MARRKLRRKPSRGDYGRGVPTTPKPKPKPSKGGRTPQEAAFGKSMEAAGHTVSPANTRVDPVYVPPSSSTSTSSSSGRSRAPKRSAPSVSPTSALTSILGAIDARDALALPGEVLRDGAKILERATKDSDVRKFDRIEAGRDPKIDPDLADLAFSVIRDFTGRDNLKKTPRGLVVKGVRSKKVPLSPGQKATRAKVKKKRAASKSATTRVEAMGGGREKVKMPKRARAKRVPETRTWGSPTLGQFVDAAEKKATRVTKGGKLATVRQLKAAGELRDSKAAFAKAKKNAKGAPKRALVKAGLDPAQAKVLNQVLTVGKRMGANDKEMLAAVETAIVEANISNHVGGDADSSGWRQERAMYYPTGAQGPNNVKASARRFFEESVSDTGGARGAGQTPGQLAQTIQASAFPDKYDAVEAQAAPLLRAFNRAPAKAVPKEVRRDLRVATERAADLGVPGANDPKAVQATAKEVGVKKLGKVPPKLVSRFKNGMMAAKYLEKLGQPYVWGGGHVAGDIDPLASGGLDCSGAVSFIGQKMGVMEGSLVSGAFGSVTEPGPGAVTVLYNPTHVLMKIGNKYFGTSSENPGGGAGFISQELGDSEMASGKYQIGHFPGMGKKVARQMGFETDGGNFPGMTVSPDGSTATIDPGAGVTLPAPGYSDRPIQGESADRRRGGGGGAYAGGISSPNLPQAYLDLVTGGTSAGENDVLEGFTTGRHRPRAR